MAIGFKLPFTPSSKYGNFDLNETTLEETKTRIRALLQTNKGERLIHRNLGTDLLRQLFNPVSNIAQIIQENIRQAINFWEPELIINSIDVRTENEDSSVRPNSANIHLDFRLKGTDLQDSLDVIIKG